MSSRTQALGWVVAVAAAMIFLYGRIDPHSPQFAGWDLHAYLRMAQAAPGLDGALQRPFAFRLLAPFLVGLSPLESDLGFYLLSAAASLACAILLYLFLCDMGVRPPFAALATVLFTFNQWFFGFTVWDSYQANDVLALLEVVVLLWALVRRRWITFGVALFAGALTRETALLLIPTAAVYLRETSSPRRQWAAWLCASLPAVALFMGLRVLVPFAGGNSLVGGLLENAAKLAQPDVWLRLLLNPLAPLTFVPLVFHQDTRRFLRDKRYLVALVLLVFLSSLFGVNNERLMAPLFPVFYWLIAKLLQDSVGARPISLPLITAATFAGSLHHLMARYPLPSRRATIVLTFATLGIVTAAALFGRLARGRPATSPASPTD